MASEGRSDAVSRDAVLLARACLRQTRYKMNDSDSGYIIGNITAAPRFLESANSPPTTFNESFIDGRERVLI